MIDLDKLLAAWPIPRSRSILPLVTGTNNFTRLVATANGEYILRIYQNAGDPEPIRYEHDLLRRLQQTALSFAVPNPLVAESGQTYVATEEAGQITLAALFPVIPGRRPDALDGTEVEVCGAALGELDRALAGIELDPQLAAPPPFGDIAYTRALILHPVAGVTRFPIAPRSLGRLGMLLDDLTTALTQFDERFPRQLIHGEFYPGNVLMDGDRVSGILDFEFSGPGVRVMDLAVGLSAFALSEWRRGGEDLPLVERFVAGYRRWVRPAPAEIAALPTLLRLREATSFVHWLGRHSQGLTTDADVADRADRLLRLDDDLSTHGEELVQRVESAIAGNASP